MPEPLLNAVFRTVESGLCLLGLDGVVLRANASWLDSMRLGEAAIGESLAVTKPDYMEVLAPLLATADPEQTIELPQRTLDGRSWHELMTPVRIGDQRALLLSSREIRVDSGEELLALKRAIDALPVGVAVVEARGEHDFQAVTRNTALARMLGAETAEAGPMAKAPHRFFLPDRVTPMTLADWPGPLAAVSGQRVPETSIHALLPNGDWRVLETSAAPVQREPGAARRAVVVAIDNTERLRAEQALRRSELTYRTAFENIRDVVLLLEAVRDADAKVVDWRYVHANSAVAALLGSTPQALVGRCMSELAPERATAVIPGFNRVLETGEPWQYEVRSWGRDFMSRVFRVDENVLGCAAMDVTELKATEASLRRSEQQLRQLVEHTPAGIALLDRQLRYLAVSRRYLQDYRIEGETILGRSLYEVLPEIPERWREIHQRCLAGEVAHADEDPFLRADGSVDWLQWEIQPWFEADGTVGGLVLFSVHVTEKKQAADRLRAAKERLAVTLASIGDAVIATDAETRVTLLNGVAEQLTGWSADEARGKPLRDVFRIVSESEGEPVANPAERALAEGVVVGLANHTALIARDGTSRPIADSAAPIRDGAGVISGVVLVFRDQTEERRAELALSRSRAELLALIEKLPIGVFVSADAEILYANPTFAAYCGRSAAALIGRRVGELAAPGASEAPGEGLEWAVLGEGGRIVILECASARELEFEGRAAQLWTCRDLTQLKAMQAKLIQSDRLANLGLLAAGVAHEINNPLAYVIGSLDLIDERVARVDAPPSASERAEVLDFLRDARHGALRVATIVRDLKAFSRSDHDERTVLDLAQLVDSAISIAGNEVKQRARLVREIGPAPQVVGNEARLGQVFLNLLVNAAHAIPEGRAEDNEIRVVLRQDASGHAVVELHDTGAGFSTQVAEHLFEPFFTTKPGIGTGLGLAISRNTVTALGGEISLESQPGVGTVARVTLPPAPITNGPTASPEPVVAGPRRARLLVIDDEAAICKVFRRLLDRDHEVITETSAQDGWTRLANGERFDLIFCDMTMPGMTGLDFYERVQQEAPELLAQLVFITGGTFTKKARDFLERIPNRCIDKPIEGTKLRRIVSQLLASDAGTGAGRDADQSTETQTAKP
jgi:PAS domain S-box-containing protein